MSPVSMLTLMSLQLQAGVAILVAIVLTWQFRTRPAPYLRWAAASWWLLAGYMTASTIGLQYAFARTASPLWHLPSFLAPASAGLHALCLVMSIRILTRRPLPGRQVLWLLAAACAAYGTLSVWYPEAGPAGMQARRFLRAAVPPLGVAAAYLSLIPTLWQRGRPRGEYGSRMLAAALGANAFFLGMLGLENLAFTFALIGQPAATAWFPLSALGQVMFGLGWVGLILETEQHDRDETAQRAARADRMLREALNASVDLIGVVDQQERLVLCNVRMADYIKEVTGLTVTPMMPYPRPGRSDDERTRFITTIQRALRGEHVSERAELFTPSGRRILLDRRIVPIREGGVVSGAFVVARDVTQDDALRQEAERSMSIEGMARMAGGLAHDFNNILTVVQTNLHLLAEAIGDDAESNDIVMETATALDRANQLTRRLLGVARERPAVPTRVDAGDLLRGFTRFLQHALGEEVVLSLDLPSGSSPVIIDAGRLEQVILNLALNGRDAMPSGGRLTIAVRCAPGGVLGAGTGDEVTITVTDEGTGMDEDTLQRAGDPFFTTKPSTVGSGLGIATCRAILAEANGTLHLDSLPGRGTTVTIRLPVAPDPA